MTANVLKITKCFVILIFLGLISSNVSSQTSYKTYLADADRYFSHDSLTYAYRLYSALKWNPEDFPGMDIPLLSQKLEATQTRIDILKKEILDAIDETNRNLRILEHSLLDKAINEEKNRWEDLNRFNGLKFDSLEHIRFLDMSNFGIVNLPQELVKFQNLKTIDLRGNPDLDTAQVNSVLTKCLLLKDIRISYSQPLSGSDSYNSNLVKLAQDLAYESVNQKINHLSVKNLIDEALEFYNQGSYSRALFRYQQANSVSDEFKKEIDILQNIVLQTIELKTLQLKEEKRKAENVKRQNEVAVFDQAVKNIDSKFTTCAYFSDQSFSEIDSLSFKDFGMIELHPYIGKCKNLKYLNLLGNPGIRWKQAERVLDKITENVSIYVTVNDLSEIDSGYWHNITGLEILKIKLKEIPENILHQNQLTYLNLSKVLSNEESEIVLPTELFNLTNLQELNLQYCQISNLPSEIGKLQRLKTLCLNNNALRYLPHEIGQLKNLEILRLQVNQLEKLPPDIGNLQNLTELTMYSNHLKMLPDDIGKLSRLTRLDLEYNKLTALPRQIANLVNITKLFLTKNQLFSLQTEICELQKLTVLYIDKNKIKSLPYEIGNLKNLSVLNLGENHLIKLPHKIGNLNNLSVLNLEENNLRKLPQMIGNLNNLSVLNLEHNDLRKLPSEIRNLENLTEIRLFYNRFKNLPSQIGKLRKFNKYEYIL
jgi:Leucine-rich repeat (LRR) protein